MFNHERIDHQRHYKPATTTSLHFGGAQSTHIPLSQQDAVGGVRCSSTATTTSSTHTIPAVALPPQQLTMTMMRQPQFTTTEIQKQYHQHQQQLQALGQQLDRVFSSASVGPKLWRPSGETSSVASVGQPHSHIPLSDPVAPTAFPTTEGGLSCIQSALVTPVWDLKQQQNPNPNHNHNPIHHVNGEKNKKQKVQVVYINTIDTLSSPSFLKAWWSMMEEDLLHFPVVGLDAEWVSIPSMFERGEDSGDERSSSYSNNHHWAQKKNQNNCEHNAQTSSSSSSAATTTIPGRGTTVALIQIASLRYCFLFHIAAIQHDYDVLHHQQEAARRARVQEEQKARREERQLQEEEEEERRSSRQRQQRNHLSNYDDNGDYGNEYDEEKEYHRGGGGGGGGGDNEDDHHHHHHHPTALDANNTAPHGSGACVDGYWPSFRPILPQPRHMGASQEPGCLYCVDPRDIPRRNSSGSNGSRNQKSHAPNLSHRHSHNNSSDGYQNSSITVIPKVVADLLLDPRVYKCGAAIKTDREKIYCDLGLLIPLEMCIELGLVARQAGYSLNFGLGALSTDILGVSLEHKRPTPTVFSPSVNGTFANSNLPVQPPPQATASASKTPPAPPPPRKNREMVTSNWNVTFLTAEQISYSIDDACASLLIFLNMYCYYHCHESVMEQMNKAGVSDIEAFQARDVALYYPPTPPTSEVEMGMTTSISTSSASGGGGGTMTTTTTSTGHHHSFESSFHHRHYRQNQNHFDHRFHHEEDRDSSELQFTMRKGVQSPDYVLPVANSNQARPRPSRRPVPQCFLTLLPPLTPQEEKLDSIFAGTMAHRSGSVPNSCPRVQRFSSCPDYYQALLDTLPNPTTKDIQALNQIHHQHQGGYFPKYVPSAGTSSPCITIPLGQETALDAMSSMLHTLQAALSREGEKRCKNCFDFYSLQQGYWDAVPGVDGKWYCLQCWKLWEREHQGNSL